MTDVTISKNTLIPVSVVGLAFAGAFWFAGLVRDVQALTIQASGRSSLEAEIIQRMASTDISIAEINAKLTILIKWEEEKRGK